MAETMVDCWLQTICFIWSTKYSWAQQARIVNRRAVSSDTATVIFVLRLKLKAGKVSPTNARRARDRTGVYLQGRLKPMHGRCMTDDFAGRSR
jgi:hypothetical protein